MTKSINRRRQGASYEEQAALHLEQLGYRILEKNFRCRTGEIDLIADDGGVIAFVEVKYRADQRYGGPFAAVNYRKQVQISRVALFYFTLHGLPVDTPSRFDVVGITGTKTQLIKNAFPFRR